jgi:hypothetical protein
MTTLPQWAVLWALLWYAAFGASLGHGFIADDFTVVPVGFAGAWHEATHSQYLRPVWWLSYPLVNAAFGQSALAHHIVGHLLHLANCALAFVLLRDWIGEGRSLGAVMAWSLAPQVAFPVGWIAQRNDLLMTLFVLLALLAAERGRRGQGAALYLIGYLAKLTCLALPLALLTRHGLRREKGDALAGMVLTALGVAGVLWGLQFYQPEAHLAALGPALRLANAAKNLALGWGLTALPLPFMASAWSIAAWAVFAALLAVLLLRHARANAAATRLLLLAALASLPLALMGELRITYLMLLFLCGGLAALPAPDTPRPLLGAVLAAWLAFAVPASHAVIARMASDEFSAAAWTRDLPEGGFYPADTYGDLRRWQERLLGR